jgi:hypothetical protein
MTDYLKGDVENLNAQEDYGVRIFNDFTPSTDKIEEELTTRATALPRSCGNNWQGQGTDGKANIEDTTKAYFIDQDKKKWRAEISKYSGLSEVE